MVKRHTPNRLHSLALKWRSLTLMAVAFARLIVSLEKTGAHEATTKAELLEAWLYSALVQLSADIARASEIERPDKDEQYALTYLKTLHALLSVLVLTISEIRRALECAACGLRKLAGAPQITRERINSYAPGAAPIFNSS